MHDDAGPDFLQSIANIGSGARKREEFRGRSKKENGEDGHGEASENAMPFPEPKDVEIAEQAGRPDLFLF